MTDTTLESAVADANVRIKTMGAQIRAMRAMRWHNEWAAGRHAEAPARPQFVKDFEAEHGPLPLSAERLLRASVPPLACRRGSGPRNLEVVG